MSEVGTILLSRFGSPNLRAGKVVKIGEGFGEKEDGIDQIARSVSSVDCIWRVSITLETSKNF
ncbi:hypothetical protein [Paraburkholderia azotifigens]|uniref:Uncharacterized protein n=1 Tax=Paraburkholderia azotifigens TaxID=2057004 RepID=A0ABU9QYE1_9BURK